MLAETADSEVVFCGFCFGIPLVEIVECGRPVSVNFDVQLQ